MRVIGTAGHVDHGKSSLIAALTGTHPDRLKEEQEREMTIDLGFGWLTLPGGEEIGFIDMPGHRDFIENMLAGVSGIDVALLVIAADEGVMPQTREHLAILDLLQIQSGLVVLTKIDLVTDPEWIDMVEADVRTVLQGTILQDVPILRVSSRTKAGLPFLIQTLSHLLQKQTPHNDLGRPRLPVDRIFSMPGFGTIVTGTLADGCLLTGDEVELLPSGLKGRIRGLQTHKQKEEIALPGSRTAVNISGLDVNQIQRGEVVTHTGQYHLTRRLDVRFRLLADASAALKHHTEVKFFIGAAETIATLRLLGVETLEPGETGWLQLELRTPVVAVQGDHYILRRPSPGETIGGGVVVDPQPKKRHKRFDDNVLVSLQTMAEGSPSDILLQASHALGPALVKDVITRSRLESSTAETALHELLESGRLLSLDDMLITALQWSRLTDTVVGVVSAYHSTFPLRRGMPREELKSKLKLPPFYFNIAMHHLVDRGVLRDTRSSSLDHRQSSIPWASLPGHTVQFSPFQQVKVDKLLAHFKDSPFAPPSVKECQAEAGEDIFNALLEAGELVAVSDEVVFFKKNYEVMLEKVRQAIHQHGQVTLAEVRDLLSTSRKYGQALLEYLDSKGVTYRDGDVRRLKQ